MTKQDKDKLTARQELFCQEYAKNPNATQAAKNAGYSEKTADRQGSRLLKNVKIDARIQEIRQERLKELRIDQLYVFNNLKKIAEATSKMRVVDINEETGEVIEAPVDAHNALKSIELMGKHLGLFDKRTDAQIAKLEAEKEHIETQTEQLKEYGPEQTTINIIDPWTDADDEAD